ncbi:hypothetical protein IDH50_03200 [Aeromicrobium tamlense]|uniref:Uncharacterized protein n=1 Tax=Aeromicrobium tamlense TaxID=375541 RepID=A0A8I0FUL3_9ACTN|nr:hypothetical protein [Aeromicrobium tamlense]MBD1269231.1 hypothetical protein [Aeromicrobium tamlense]NYI36861.1 hypothetical protein [Aeromicrobium tamlense]
MSGTGVQRLSKTLHQRIVDAAIASWVPSRRSAHERAHAQLKAMSEGAVAEPTAFQQRVQAEIEESARKCEALIEALSDPSTDAMTMRKAAGEFSTGMASRVLALELRMALLEESFDLRVDGSIA